MTFSTEKKFIDSNETFLSTEAKSLSVEDEDVEKSELKSVKAEDALNKKEEILEHQNKQDEENNNVDLCKNNQELQEHCVNILKESVEEENDKETPNDIEIDSLELIKHLGLDEKQKINEEHEECINILQSEVQEIATPNRLSNFEEPRNSDFYAFPSDLGLKFPFKLPKNTNEGNNIDHKIPEEKTDAEKRRIELMRLASITDENLNEKVEEKKIKLEEEIKPEEEKQVAIHKVINSNTVGEKKKKNKQINIIDIDTAIRAFEIFLKENKEMYDNIYNNKNILLDEAKEILPNWNKNTIIKDIEDLYNKIKKQNNEENSKGQLIEKLNSLILSPETIENVGNISLLVNNYFAKHEAKKGEKININADKMEMIYLSVELQGYRRKSNVLLCKMVEYLKDYPLDYFNLFGSFSNDYTKIIASYKDKYYNIKNLFDNNLKGFIKILTANNSSFLKQCGDGKIEDPNCYGNEPKFNKLRIELLNKFEELKNIDIVKSVSETNQVLKSELHVNDENSLKGTINNLEKIYFGKKTKILNKINFIEKIENENNGKLLEQFLNLLKSEKQQINTLEEIIKRKKFLFCIKTLIEYKFESYEEIIKRMLLPEKHEKTHTQENVEETKHNLIVFINEYHKVKSGRKEIKEHINKLLEETNKKEAKILNKEINDDTNNQKEIEISKNKTNSTKEMNNIKNKILREQLSKLLKSEKEQINTLEEINKRNKILQLIKILIDRNGEDEEMKKIIEEMLMPEKQYEQQEQEKSEKQDEKHEQEKSEKQYEKQEQEKFKKTETNLIVFIKGYNKEKTSEQETIEKHINEMLETLLEAEKDIKEMEKTDKKKIKTLKIMLKFLNEYNIVVDDIVSYVDSTVRKELEEITINYKKLNLFSELNNLIEKLYKSSYRLALSSEQTLKSLEKINKKLNKIKNEMTKEYLNDKITIIKNKNGLNAKFEKLGDINGLIDIDEYLNKIEELKKKLKEKLEEMEENKLKKDLKELEKIKENLNKIKMKSLNKSDKLIKNVTKKYINEHLEYIKNKKGSIGVLEKLGEINGSVNIGEYLKKIEELENNLKKKLEKIALKKEEFKEKKNELKKDLEELENITENLNIIKKGSLNKSDELRKKLTKKYLNNKIALIKNEIGLIGELEINEDINGLINIDEYLNKFKELEKNLKEKIAFEKEEFKGENNKLNKHLTKVKEILNYLNKIKHYENIEKLKNDLKYCNNIYQNIIYIIEQVNYKQINFDCIIENNTSLKSESITSSNSSKTSSGENSLQTPSLGSLSLRGSFRASILNRLKNKTRRRESKDFEVINKIEVNPSDQEENCIYSKILANKEKVLKVFEEIKEITEKELNEKNKKNEEEEYYNEELNIILSDDIPSLLNKLLAEKEV